jgi:predicted metal-binding membrane protein
LTPDASSLEAAWKRDRAILVAFLLGTGGLAWIYMVHMAFAMGGAHTGHAMMIPHSLSWGIWEILMAFSMWIAMMVAMMVPVVTPWLLVFSRTLREKDPRLDPFPKAGFFLLGYLAIWIAYSGLATLGQWGLHAAALLSPGLNSTSPVLGGALLLAAGFYQLMPFRVACMVHCRSPLGFFLASWKDGRFGAFTMGFRHGLYCVGCCWALMALSFAFGVMNLLWMAGLTAFLLVEKVASAGPRMSKAAGWLLSVCGLWMLGKALLPV